MKIRIRGNSVRLRLLQSEVLQLGESGKVSETTKFGLTENEILTYTLQVSDKSSEVQAGFCSNEICITLPTNVAKHWVESDEVSIESETDSLKILVEKDFVCLTRKDDPDNLDAFPNPDINC